MDGSRGKDDVGDFSPHSCEHCKDIIFTLGTSVSFSLEEVERADEAGCEFFRLTYRKYTATNIAGVPNAPKLIIICGEMGLLDIRWKDGATTLFDSSVVSPCAFTISAHENGRASADIESRPLNLYPGSEEQIHRIGRWSHRCRLEHKKCMELRKTECQQRPARLIEVGVLDSKEIRISDTESIGLVEYAILSYCWGGDQESKTMKARLEQRRNGFSIDELPQTIQDAVFLARKLKLEYLWVDAICILQDDDGDKGREITKMDQIYRGASITFVAARAEKASEGFLEQREPSHCYGTVCQMQYRQNSGGPAIVQPCFVSAKAMDITYEDPIDRRGWTLQERYRSFRTVRFGSKQTVWECPTRRWVDGGINSTYETSSDPLFTGTIADLPYPFRLDDSSHKDDLNRALGAWEDIVADYSGRVLTEHTDRLPAFAAMAKAFGAFLGLKPSQYLAGLWDFDICMQLRWWRSDCESGNQWATERSGPSWSWASSTGSVIFEDPRLSYGTDTLRIEDWEIEPKLPDFEYGEVSRGHLIVSGYLCISIRQGQKYFGWHPFLPESCFLPLVAHWDSDEEQPAKVWCLEISVRDSSEGRKSSGLLLSKQHGETYKRVGYFDLYHDMIQPNIIDGDWFSSESAYQKICIE